jgi:hydroxymethylglutaryl-CoA reductase (NADPH)
MTQSRRIKSSLSKELPKPAEAPVSNSIGVLPLPMSKVGPLVLNGRSVFVPLVCADAELIHRVNIGCRALESAGGAFAKISRDSVTLSPLIALPSVLEATAFANFVEDPQQLSEMQQRFSEVSSFLELQAVRCQLVGRRIFIRFTASGSDTATSDIMNQGVQRIFQHLSQAWTGAPIQVIPDLLEAVDNSGKHVTAEATIPVDVLNSILSTNADAVMTTFAERQTVKSQIMQSAAARKLVASLMLATGQDISQPAASANVLETACEAVRSTVDERLITSVRIKCVIPSLEIETSGGLTRQGAQRECLEMVDAAGTDLDTPGAKAQRLAEVICATVLALEIGALSPRAATKEFINKSNIGRRAVQQTASSNSHLTASPQRYSYVPTLAQESLRGLSTANHSVNDSTKTRNPAYLELMAEKCAAEFGWADPRLTVP